MKQAAMNTAGISNIHVDDVPLVPFWSSSPSVPVPVYEATPGGALDNIVLDTLGAAGVTLMPVGIIVSGGLSEPYKTTVIEHEYKHVPQELLLGPAFYLLYGLEYGVLTGLYGNQAVNYQIAEQIARIQNREQQDWNWWPEPMWWPAVTATVYDLHTSTSSAVSNWGQETISSTTYWFDSWWPW